jgi:hypothetical protein
MRTFAVIGLFIALLAGVAAGISGADQEVGGKGAVLLATDVGSNGA